MCRGATLRRTAEGGCPHMLRRGGATSLDCVRLRLTSLGMTIEVAVPAWLCRGGARSLDYVRDDNEPQGPSTALGMTMGSRDSSTRVRMRSRSLRMTSAQGPSIAFGCASLRSG